ncbi:MAG: hypothetical protein N2C14_18730 [Planctomycetales bacterium]
MIRDPSSLYKTEAANEIDPPEGFPQSFADPVETRGTAENLVISASGILFPQVRPSTIIMPRRPTSRSINDAKRAFGSS